MWLPLHWISWGRSRTRCLVYMYGFVSVAECYSCHPGFSFLFPCLSLWPLGESVFPPLQQQGSCSGVLMFLLPTLVIKKICCKKKTLLVWFLSPENIIMMFKQANKSTKSQFALMKTCRFVLPLFGNENHIFFKWELPIHSALQIVTADTYTSPKGVGRERREGESFWSCLGSLCLKRLKTEWSCFVSSFGFWHS